MPYQKDLSLKEKIKILDKIETKPPNTPLRELEAFLGASKSALARLKTNESVICEQWSAVCTATAKNGNVANRKRKREGKDPDVEEALDKWFTVVTERGVIVTGSLLKKKVDKFAESIGHGDFQATDGWGKYGMT